MKHLYLSIVLFLSYSLTGFAQSSGNALGFDGSNDYVSSSVPTVLADPATKDHTVELWVNITSYGTSRMLHAQASTSNFVSLLLNSSGRPYYFVQSGGSLTSYNSGYDVPLNTWTHLAFTWDASTSTGSIYVNGVLQNSISGGSSSTGSNSVMALGARSDGTQNFNGTLDEMRIWSTVRTQCQIQANMNTIIPNTTSNLAHHYRFTHGVAGGNNTGVTTLSDISGSTNGTLNNFALTGTSSNWVSSGVNITTTGIQNTITTVRNDSVCYNGSYTFTGGVTVNNITSTVSDTTIVTGGSCDTLLITFVEPRTVSVSDFYFSVCNGDSYTFPDGGVLNNITAPVTDTSYLTDRYGCDSLVVVELSVNPTYFQTITDTICAGDSYTYPDGSVMNNIYLEDIDTTYLQTNDGCDSIIVVNLGVKPSYFNTVAEYVCPGDDYVMPDGDTLFAVTLPLIDTSYLQTDLGCDSIVVVDLNINPTSLSTLFDTVCSGDQYVFPDGSVMTGIQDGLTDTSVLVSSIGCDSTIYVYLAVDPLPNVSITENGTELTASGDVDDLVWYLDGTALSATGSTYTATVSGSYNVLSTNSFGCSAFADTVNVTIVGVAEQLLVDQIKVYPNPTTDQLHLSIDVERSTKAELSLLDMSGRVVLADTYQAEIGATTHTMDIAQLDGGLYLLQVTIGNNTQILKVAKY